RARRGVVERGEQPLRPGVVGTALQAESALADRVKHPARVEDFGDVRTKAETFEARLGEDGRVEVLLDELAQTGLDVAANVDELEVGPTLKDLGTPAKTARADHGPFRQL